MKRVAPTFHNEIVQGTTEWAEVRCGKVTASRFKDVMAGGRGGDESKTRKLYLRQLAGEIISGIPMETYKNRAMEHGQEIESEARTYYQFMTNQSVDQVGFVSAGRIGCSPDGMIGDRGMLEIKRQEPALLIERLEGDGSIPKEHMPQCQGNMLVAGRDWIDIAIYFPKMPMFKRRVPRDENFIRRMEVAIGVFIEELDDLVEKINRYGQR